MPIVRNYTPDQLADLLAGGAVVREAKMPHTPTSKPLKYRNKKTTVDGITFDSKKECERYMVLKALVKAGAIQDLQLQPEYRIEINGQLVTKYRPDFSYDGPAGLTIEDVKSPATRKNRAYRIKVKLMKAVYGIEIKEV